MIEAGFKILASTPIPKLPSIFPKSPMPPSLRSYHLFLKCFSVTLLFTYARACLMSLIDMPSSEINYYIHMPAL